MRSMTDQERETVKKEYYHYSNICKKFNEEDPYLACRSDAEREELEAKYNYNKEMAELKGFQLNHSLQLTAEEEESVNNWIKEGFNFKFDDFTDHFGDSIPIDDLFYGICYLDYFHASPSSGFKAEIEQYINTKLLHKHIKDDSEYCIELIKKIQMAELYKYLAAAGDELYSQEQIKKTKQWISEGHSFWKNPFGKKDCTDHEMNYLQALYSVELG